MGEAGKGVASDKGGDGEIRDGEPGRQSQPYGYAYECNAAAEVEKEVVVLRLLVLKRF